MSVLANTRQATQNVSKFQKSLGVLGKVGKGAALGGIALVGTALTKGFSRLNNIDVATTKMKALGYSAKQSQSLMDSALKSVKGTSFGLDEAATAAASAAAAGIKPGQQMDAYLKMIADTASLTGRSMTDMGAIMNKVNTNGVASMAELNQINDSGIGITQELAKHYGVTALEMRKMVSSGEVDAATFNKVMASMTNDAAKTMGTTLPATIANIGASLGRIGANFLSGVFPMFQGGAQGILDALGGLEPKAVAMGEAISNGIAKVMPFLTRLGDKFTENKGKLTPLANSAKKLFGSISDSVQPVINGLKGFGEFLAPIATFLGKVALGAVFVALKATLDTLSPVIETVASAFESMGTWLASNKETIGVVAAVIGTALLPVMAAVAVTLATQAINAGITAAAWLAYGVVVKTISVATKAWAVVQWVLNAAMSANPIGLVVIAIVALVAAFVIAYKKSDTFRAIVNKAFALVKQHATLLWNGIKAAFSKITNAIGTAASWIKTKMGQAKDGFTVLVNGVVSMHRNIVAKVSAVIGFFKSVPGKIKGAIGNAGSMLSTIGSQIMQGLKNGITGAWHMVTSAVTSLVNKIPKKIREIMGIASPSKVTTKLGRYITQGLNRGIIKEMPNTVTAVKNLAKVIDETLPKSIKKKGSKAIAKWNKDHQKELAKATKQTLVAIKRDAVARLNALKKQRNDYAAAVKETAKSYAGLSNIQLGENETLSGGTIKNFLADRLSGIKTFNKKLAELSKKGLSKDLYNQIVQMGPEQGLAYAEALASSTPAQLAELNKMQAEIDKASGALGNSTAKTMYQSGIDSAEGFVKGLNKMLKKVAGMGTKISKSLIKALKKALGIKSPSKVTAGLARWTGLGFTRQLERTIPNIEKIGAQMGTAITKGYKSPSLDGPKLNASAGNGSTQKNYYIEIKADATTDRVALGKELKKVIAEAEKAGAR